MRHLFYTLAFIQAAMFTPAVFSQGVSSLREREKLVQGICRQMLPSVVSLSGWKTHSGSLKGATGVIISEDGVVLTQFHVSHWQGEGDTSGHPIGTSIPVMFADGKATTATLLGGDVGKDFGHFMRLFNDEDTVRPMRKILRRHFLPWFSRSTASAFDFQRSRA